MDVIQQVEVMSAFLSDLEEEVYEDCPNEQHANDSPNQ